jgi:tetratricopeptide (TPR) repeat protein
VLKNKNGLFMTESIDKIKENLVFFELKPEVAERLGLPATVPILQADLDQELAKGKISPSAIAAGIEALKFLKPATPEYDPFLARYYSLEGQRFMQENPPDYFQAQRFLQKAIDLEAGAFSAEAAYYLATILEPDDPEKAIAYYRRSIELYPKSAAAHFELALLLRERRDLEGAMHEFLEAYRIDPNSANLLNEIGDTHLLNNNWDNARAAFARAADLDKEYWVLPIKLGIADYQVQDFRAAVKHLRIGLEKTPDVLNDTGEQELYLQGLYYLAMAYKNLGDPVRARKLYQSILQIAPDFQLDLDD